MYYTYGSMVGVCNIIFTAAAFVLTISQWQSASSMKRVVLIFGCCLFTVIQPSLVYLKAKRQVSNIKEDTEVTFDDRGIHIKAGNKRSDVTWDVIKKISKKPTMIVIFSDTTHGFVLSNRVLGKDQEAFYQFVLSKIHRDSPLMP